MPIKKSLSLIFLLSSPLIADSGVTPTSSQDEGEMLFKNLENETGIQEVSQPVTSPPPTLTPPSPPAVSTVQTAAPKMMHYTLYGEMLYFKPIDTSTIWAERKDNTDSSHITERKYGFDFDWNFGFRLGIAFETTWNDLLFDLNWTRFHTHTVQTEEDAAILADPNTSPGFGVTYDLNLVSQTLSLTGNPFEARGKYIFYFDQIDWTVGKKLSLAKNFSLTPFGGVRGIIAQYRLRMKLYSDFWGDVEVTQEPLNYISMNLNDRLYAVGLMGGILGSLNLGKGFSYFLGVDGFIGAGTDKTSNHEAVYNGSTIAQTTVKMKETSHTTVKTMIDIATGFDWRRNLIKDKLDLLLNLSYEFHMLFNTPSFVYETSSVNGTMNPNTNVAFHGLSASAGFHF